MLLQNAACELKRKVGTALFAAVLLSFAPAAASASHFAGQEHPPTAVPAPAGQEAHEGEAEHHDQSIGGMIRAMAWPVANFVILLGVIYYFANQPLKDFLATRSS